MNAIKLRFDFAQVDECDEFVGDQAFASNCQSRSNLSRHAEQPRNGREHDAE